MHDLNFCEAVKPRTPIILRLPMLSYSVGHEILLLNQINPLLFDRHLFDKLPVDQQRAAIIRAALVCYRTWRQNQTPEKYLRLWSWLIRRSNWSAEIAEFRNYRSAGSQFPPVPKQEHYVIAAGLDGKEEIGRFMGGSYLARLLTFLARGGLYKSIGFETPYDVPFGMANYLYLSELETDGAARIENEREAQVRMEMEAHEAEIKQENEEAKSQWEACKTDDERREAVITNPRILSVVKESLSFAPVDQEK